MCTYTFQGGSAKEDNTVYIGSTRHAIYDRMLLIYLDFRMVYTFHGMGELFVATKAHAAIYMPASSWDMQIHSVSLQYG